LEKNVQLVTAEDKLMRVLTLKEDVEADNKMLNKKLSENESKQNDQAKLLHEQIDELTNRFTFQQKNADELIRKLEQDKKSYQR